MEPTAFELIEILKEEIEVLDTEEAIDQLLISLDDTNTDLKMALEKGQINFSEYVLALDDASYRVSQMIEILRREGQNEYNAEAKSYLQNLFH